MLELIYTSTKSGLKNGQSGFASVAWTSGIPTNYITPLENASGYKIIYLPNDPDCDKNPVCCAYQKITSGSLQLKVASRIAYAGLDYTARSNKIAHHIVLESHEITGISPGPIGLFMVPGNFCTKWDGPARLLPQKTDCISPVLTGSCYGAEWLSWKGDAGWAGYIAQKFADKYNGVPKASQYLYIEFDTDIPAERLISLFAEAASLLEPEMLEDFTFNTYFTQTSGGTECFLRAALSDSLPMETARKYHPQDVISLRKQEMIPPGYEESPYVLAARNGTKDHLPSKDYSEEKEPDPIPILQESDEPDNRTILLPKEENISNNTIHLRTSASDVSRTIHIRLPSGNNLKPVFQDAPPPVATKKNSARKYILFAIMFFAILVFAAVLISISFWEKAPEETVENNKYDNRKKAAEKEDIEDHAVSRKPRIPQKNINKKQEVRTEKLPPPSRKFPPKAKKPKAPPPPVHRKPYPEKTENQEKTVSQKTQRLFENPEEALKVWIEMIRGLRGVDDKVIPLPADFQTAKMEPVRRKSFEITVHNGKLKLHLKNEEKNYNDSEALAEFNRLKTLQLIKDDTIYELPVGFRDEYKKLLFEIKIASDYEITISKKRYLVDLMEWGIIKQNPIARKAFSNPVKMWNEYMDAETASGKAEKEYNDAKKSLEKISDGHCEMLVQEKTTSKKQQKKNCRTKSYKDFRNSNKDNIDQLNTLMKEIKAGEKKQNTIQKEKLNEFYGKYSNLRTEIKENFCQWDETGDFNQINEKEIKQYNNFITGEKKKYPDELKNYTVENLQKKYRAHMEKHENLKSCSKGKNAAERKKFQKQNDWKKIYLSELKKEADKLGVYSIFESCVKNKRPIPMDDKKIKAELKNACERNYVRLSTP